MVVKENRDRKKKINCHENENDNDKIDHINKIHRDQDADIETKYRKYSVSQCLYLS